MSRGLTLRCAAKINLSLDVTGKRPDGYHTLDSIFQSVTVYDTLDLSAEDGEGIVLECDAPGVPCDERNLAWRAAAALLTASGKQARITIRLTKCIPSGAGMGGGSADAAGVLYGLNELLGCGFTNAQLREIGVKLGADVPFMLLGGMARVAGIGEVLRPFPTYERMHLVIVKGEAPISTPAAYRAIDALTAPHHPDVQAMQDALTAQNTAAAAACCGNLFEQAVDCADVVRAKQRLLDSGALAAVMTGSGAAVVGIFPDAWTEEQLNAAADVLRAEFVFAQAAHPTTEPFIITGCR